MEDDEDSIDDRDFHYGETDEEEIKPDLQTPN